MAKIAYYIGVWFFIWGLLILSALTIVLYKSIVHGLLSYFFISGVFYGLVRRSVLIPFSSIGYSLSYYYFYKPEDITDIFMLSIFLLTLLIFMYFINKKRFLALDKKYK